MTFASSTGTLRLDHSSTFHGEIFKFAGNGSLSGSDHIDLRDIKYSSVHDSYSNGVLTLTDGRGDTAKLSLNGSYRLANFRFANDGSGGTIVYDPPVTSLSGQNAATPQTTVPPATTGTANADLAAANAAPVKFAPSTGTSEVLSVSGEGWHGPADIALTHNLRSAIYPIAIRRTVFCPSRGHTTPISRFWATIWRRHLPWRAIMVARRLPR